jgi:hypothetical protein
MTMLIADLHFCEEATALPIVGAGYKGNMLQTDVKVGLKTAIDLKTDVDYKSRSGGYKVTAAVAGGGAGAASVNGEAKVSVDLGIATSGAAAKRAK